MPAFPDQTMAVGLCTHSSPPSQCTSSAFPGPYQAIAPRCSSRLTAVIRGSNLIHPSLTRVGNPQRAIRSHPMLLACHLTTSFNSFRSVSKTSASLSIDPIPTLVTRRVNLPRVSAGKKHQTAQTALSRWTNPYVSSPLVGTGGREAL